MTEAVVEITATATFVVRFWREWSGSQPRWRGRIEHAQSGQGASFLDAEGLLGFLERFGIGGEAFDKGIIGREADAGARGSTKPAS
jgi:hypothetical protein